MLLSLTRTRGRRKEGVTRWSSESILTFIFSLWLLLKVKYLRSAFRRSRSLKWPDFPCLSEPGFGIMPLSSALSQLQVLCVAQLFLTPGIICLRCARLNLHTFAFFVPSIVPHVTRATYSTNGFHKLSWLRLKPATPPMREPALWARSQSDLLVSYVVTILM